MPVVDVDNLMVLVTLVTRVPLVKRIRCRWTPIALDGPDDSPPNDVADSDAAVAAAVAAPARTPDSFDN